MIKLLLILVLSPVLAFGTNQVYPLHPSVGDTLSLVEKLDYSLFPNIPNKAFDYGFITFEENNYVLNVSFQEKLQKHVLSKETIIEAQQNIEKINQYYRLRAKMDSLPEDNKSMQPDKKAPVLFNENMNEEMKRQVRMNVRLQEDARRMREYEMGIRPNELRIEFK